MLIGAGNVGRVGRVGAASRSAAGRGSVNDARYADYIAFADPRAGLYALPDGLGGKRPATAAEFWATPANVAFDSALYGVQDVVLSARTSVSAAVTAVANATEATLVFESYARTVNDRVVQPSGTNDLFYLVGANNAQMIASATALGCSRRRGSITSRFRGVAAWSAVGRTLALNGGDAAADAVQPGARTSLNFIAGRYSFIGLIPSRKTAAWIKGNSFPEPTCVIHGDSMAQGSVDLGFWSTALSALIPGSPPMENMGNGGDDGATTVTKFLLEAPELAAHRIVFSGHNGYSAATWKTQVASMIAATNGGLANFALFPVFPSFADDTPVLADKMALHAYMKATYGDHYLHETLDNVVALGGPGQAYADPASFAKGVPPAGLRFDNLHLNPTCNETIIAPLVRAAFGRLGWRV